MGYHRSIKPVLMTSIFVTLQLIFSGFCVAWAQNSSAPTGWWLDRTGRAGIMITACGNDLCGRIEWLRNPLNDAGVPKTDTKNKNPSLRSRTICGLPIVGNFVQAGSNSWSGGWIYNPDDGATYKSTMRLAADDTLHLRGYIGIPLLGKSEIWTRPPRALAACNGH